MKIKLKKQFIPFLFLLLIFSFIFSFQITALAQEPLVEEVTAECKCEEHPNDEVCRKYCGDYKLDDAVNKFIIVSKLILGLTGSIALLAFVIGGVMFLISSGNKNLIEKGKSTILGAVIGLVIVFTSYMIIGFLLTSFGVNGSDSWFKIGGLLG